MQHEQCNLRLPPEARARLRKLATQTRRTPSAVIEILLSRAVALDEPDIALVDAAEGAPKDASWHSPDSRPSSRSHDGDDLGPRSVYVSGSNICYGADRVRSSLR
jgi:hypothetical protein